MQLVSMIFKGYRWFMLGAHDTVTWTPMSIEQVILGSNGSGKSSLMAEIYNIVPSSDSFEVGGGKEEILQVGSRLYKATSMFPTKAGHHSFQISDDGETWTELNESGLQTDQKMLVQEYLNLDPDLCDLMTDKVRFSKMDPSARRAWMMRICGTNFDFINELHATLKKKHRDFKGALDVFSESLGDAIKDMMAISDDVSSQAEELASLEELAVGVSAKIEEMGSRRDTSDNLRRKVQSAVGRLQFSSNHMPTLLKKRRPEYYYLPIEEISESRWAEQDKVSEIKGRSKALEDRLHDVQSAIDAIGRDNLKDPSGVTSRIESLQAEMLEFEAHERPAPDVELEYLQEMFNSAELAIKRLQPIMSDMPEVHDLPELKRAHAEGVVKKDVLTIELGELTGMSQKLAVRLEHYNHVDDVDCPQCKNRFKPGMDSNLARTYEDKLQRNKTREAEIHKELESINQTLQTYDELVGVVRRYREVVVQHPLHSDLWRTMESQKLHYSAPMELMMQLGEHSRRLGAMIRYRRLSNDLLKQKTILASLEGDTGHLLDLAEKLECELFDMREQWHQQVATVKAMDNDLAVYAECCKEVESFNKSMEEYVKLATELHETTAFEYMVDVRKQVNTRIATLHALQTRHKALTDRINSLNAQIDEAKEKFEVYKLLDKATSPTEGIAAEAIKGFMDTFLELMNSHIARVWSYDMHLAAAPDKGQNFTCQFPMYVAGNPRPSADFKHGSTGQVSMVDFAFKLVVFKLEGMDNMPLLADEFGKDFDDEHRERLVGYIQELIEDKEFCQLFMVSHYSSVYSAFKHAEFVVIDGRNITVPAEHNTSITFT